MLVTVGLVVGTPLVKAASGDLDTSFGAAGKVTTDLGGQDFANAIVVQPDGKLAVAGSAGSDFALARYNSDGTLDASFGAGGIVLTDFGAFDAAKDLLIQPDGKLVAVGGTSSGQAFAVARYNSDGSLDGSFGVGGKVKTNFGGPVSNTPSANSVLMLADGRLVVVGLTETGDFGLVRYNPDGSLDLTFGSGGRVVTDFGAFARASDVVLQPDGKMVVAGSALGDFALTRYNPDGSLDASFGSGGIVSTDFNASNDAIFGLAIQSDGKLIAAGFGGVPTSSPGDFALARYNPDGTLDEGFGTAGKVLTDFGGQDGAFGGVQIQDDGKVVAAGRTSILGTGFALTRYTPDGALDPTFGSGGKVVTDFGFFFDGGLDLVIQPDGNIVVAGRTDNDFALARYLDGGGAPPDIAVSAVFDWSMPDRLQLEDEGEPIFFTHTNGEVYLAQGELINPEEDSGWQVDLDACGSSAVGAAIHEFRWVIDGGATGMFESVECSTSFSFPSEGSFDVELTVVALDGDGQLHTATTSKQVLVNDWLIVSIGDSVASGEGNPDVPGKLGFGEEWQNAQCHRSANAGPVDAARRLEASSDKSSVTLVHLACSGATVGQGLLGAYEGAEPDEANPVPPQILRVAELTGAREIDALIVSIGANDIGFAQIIKECALSDNCHNNDKLLKSLITDLSAKLPKGLAQLASCLGPSSGSGCDVERVDGSLMTVNLGILSERVFLTEYFDPSRDDSGGFCDEDWTVELNLLKVVLKRLPGVKVDLTTSVGITAPEFQWVSESLVLGQVVYLQNKNSTAIVSGLNRQLEEAASLHSWSFVTDIAVAFQVHGYCAIDNWIVRLGETLEMQGLTRDPPEGWLEPKFPPKGIMHPNEDGHDAYGEFIFEMVETELIE